MFSDFAIASYFAIGATGWIYYKVNHGLGFDTKNTLIISLGLGALIFIIVYTVLGFVF